MAVIYQSAPKELSAPKSRDSLRLRRRFLPPPPKIARSFGTPRCAISSAKKIASEPRFLLRSKWVKLVLAAEFPAIPSSADKIASERRCAILVHSAKERRRRRAGTRSSKRVFWWVLCVPCMEPYCETKLVEIGEDRCRSARRIGSEMGQNRVKMRSNWAKCPSERHKIPREEASKSR